MVQPEYCVCKQCVKNGRFFMVFFSKQREEHMQGVHGLTGDGLKAMILEPRSYFLSLEQVVKMLQRAPKVEDLESE